MKTFLFAFVLFTLFLSACNPSNVNAEVPNPSEAKAAQAMVDQFSKAYSTYDADLLISLLHDDYIFMDYGLGDGPITKGNIIYFIKEAMADPESSGFQVDSYIITPDGRFAVLNGPFALKSKSTGKLVETPSYSVLEFRDGMIIAETWY